MSELCPVIEALKERGYERANIGIIGFSGAFRSYTFAYQECNLSRKELPHADLIEATPLLEQIQMIKTLEEIYLLERMEDCPSQDRCHDRVV